MYAGLYELYAENVGRNSEFKAEGVKNGLFINNGRNLSIPAGSLYMKSEDVLYEIKKIQQEEALEHGYVYEQVRWKRPSGMN